MGLLDDAIREHLELKRRRGANPDEVARQEEAALGPPRRGDFAQPGAEPAAGPAEDFERPPAEAGPHPPRGGRPRAVRRRGAGVRPARGRRAGARADERRGVRAEPAADDVAAYEPEPAADERGVRAGARGRRGRCGRAGGRRRRAVRRRSPPPRRRRRTSRRAAADEAAPYEPAPAADAVVPSEQPLADLGDLPAEPAPRRRTPAADWLDDEPDEVPTEEALERPRPAAEPGDEDAPPPGDEDVLEETPDFLQETPEHDRLWFEQRPPRDFDFDK